MSGKPQDLIEPYMPSEASKAKQRERMKRWREANKDHRATYLKQWKEANKESQQAYQQAYQASYRQRDEVQQWFWEKNLRRNYRMTPECFNKLWAEQNGKCAVCSVEMLPRGRDKSAACVDHNHETNEVRGLLCRACNHGIGNLKDSPDVLEAAAAYLRKKGHYGP